MKQEKLDMERHRHNTVRLWKREAALPGLAIRTDLSGEVAFHLGF